MSARFVVLSGALAVAIASPALTAQSDKRAVAGRPATAAADVNAADAYGTTALHRAVEANDPAEVTRLVRAGANVNAANRYRATPLSIAALGGNVAIVRALLEGGADPNALLGAGEPVILTAARTGNVEVVKALAAAGADVQVRERFYGQTPLMWAAIENHAEVIRALGALGADVNARANVLEGEPTWRNGKDSRNGINGEALQTLNTNFSKGGLTALMYAARQGATEAARALMDLGASASTTDPEGYAPLQIAIVNSQYDTAAALIEKGANVNQADRSGQTPLFAVVDQRSLLWAYNRPTPRAQNTIDSLELAKRLLAKGAKVDAKLSGPARRPLGGGGSQLTGKGATAFLRAAVTSDLPMMKLLMEHGADPRVKTDNGHTAIHAAAGLRWNDNTMRPAVAAGFGQEEDSLTALQMLVDLGLDVNAADNNGFTAMHGAAERGANDVVRFLFQHGAKLDPASKPSVQVRPVDNEPPLQIPSLTPIDSALDSDPPRPETVALLRELMGQDPAAAMRAPSKKR